MYLGDWPRSSGALSLEKPHELWVLFKLSISTSEVADERFPSGSYYHVRRFHLPFMHCAWRKRACLFSANTAAACSAALLRVACSRSAVKAASMCAVLTLRRSVSAERLAVRFCCCSLFQAAKTAAMVLCCRASLRLSAYQAQYSAKIDKQGA